MTPLLAGRSPWIAASPAAPQKNGLEAQTQTRRLNNSLTSHPRTVTLRAMITLDEIRTALRQVRHDHHAFAVAERETWEEIGVRVTPHQRVGPLPMRPIERNARRESLTLWPFVCHDGHHLSRHSIW